MFQANVLFGNAAKLNARRPHRVDYYESDLDDDISAVVENSKPQGLVGFFFGFMFEEPLRDPDNLDDEILRIKTSELQPSIPLIWNTLNTPLFIAYSLTTAATAVPVTLIPAMSETLLFNDDNTQNAAAFAPKVTAYAVLGTAFGKFILSSMGDICGARRTSVVCSMLMSASLLGLSLCQTAAAARWACFFVEFFQSVQWPCIIVVLATHYRTHGNAAYEGGIYVTSLASRFGVLVGIPASSILLRHTNWRMVAAIGAWAAMVASSVTYLFVWDSAQTINDPQNPIDPQTLAHYRRRQPSLANVMSLLLAIFHRNVAPSLKHVLKSPAFYIVAIAHTGSSAVRTSERILGSYYLDTSLNSLSENRAGGLAVFLSIGTILGLMVAGNMYTRGTERQRKRLVTNLYFSTIVSCYVLAILAIPRLRTTLNAPMLVLIFQVMATFVMGFSIAVQLYHIPSLVGATFGCDKGLYAGYTDGVAYALSSLVWRVVGNSVQTDGSAGAGWAYGWAAVALILIISAIFMVEFMEHYFVRPGARTKGGYETIMFA